MRVLSPGDDGDVVQSISSTTTSVAQTISTTLQQSVQQILPPAASVALIDPALTTRAGITVPSLPQPVWPKIFSDVAAATADASGQLLLLAGIDAISLDDDPLGTTGPIEFPTFSLGPFDAPTGVPFDPARLSGVSPGLFTEAVAPGRQWTRGAPVVAATRQGTAPPAGGATRPSSKPRAPWRFPPPAPFGFGPDLSPGAAAIGSSSALGGFALLLGALLVIVPSALQLIWVGVATRPRRFTPGPPERPG